MVVPVVDLGIEIEVVPVIVPVLNRETRLTKALSRRPPFADIYDIATWVFACNALCAYATFFCQANF